MKRFKIFLESEENRMVVGKDATKKVADAMKKNVPHQKKTKTKFVSPF